MYQNIGAFGSEHKNLSFQKRSDCPDHNNFQLHVFACCLCILYSACCIYNQSIHLHTHVFPTCHRCLFALGHALISLPQSTLVLHTAHINFHFGTCVSACAPMKNILQTANLSLPDSPPLLRPWGLTTPPTGLSLIYI